MKRRTRIFLKRSAAEARRRRGFALIAVLFMMALLLIVIIAFASHITVEISSSGNTELRSQARQNALLAMNLAINALQKNMGPDQRVSATAGILDSSDSIVTPTNVVAQPYWTGVWNSYTWNGNVATPPNPNPANNFRCWLVSAPTNSTNSCTNYNAPLAPVFNSTNSVIMVSSGTYGSNTYSNATLAPVVVWKVPADTYRSGRQGNCAWWVGDQGVKANVSLFDPRTNTLSTSQTMSLMAAAPRVGLETLNAYDDIEDNVDITNMSKLLTYDTLPLVLTNSDGTTNNFQQSFFDLTVNSHGVLSDTQHGGLRMDLSLLFEQPTLPANFNQHPIFTDTTTTTFTNYTMTNTAFYTNGPDWNLVWRYYNLYTNMTLDSDGVPVFDFDNYNNMLRTNGIRDFILPQVSRFQTLYGLANLPIYWYNNYVSPDSTGANVSYPTNYPMTNPVVITNQVFLLAYPCITLWNPYNVRLRSSPISTATNLAFVAQMPDTPFECSFDGGTTWTEDYSPFYDSSGCLFSLVSENQVSGSGGKPFIKINLNPGAFEVWSQLQGSDTMKKHYYPVTGTLAGPRWQAMCPGMSFPIPETSEFLTNCATNHPHIINPFVQATNISSVMTMFNVLVPTGTPQSIDMALQTMIIGDTSPSPGSGSYNSLFSGFMINTYFGGSHPIDQNAYPPHTIPVTGSTIPTFDPNNLSSGAQPNFTPVFMCNWDKKIYPYNQTANGPFALLNDPLNPFDVQFDADPVNAQYQPWQITITPLSGGGSGTPPTYILPSGNSAEAVQINNNIPTTNTPCAPNNAGYIYDSQDNKIYNYVWTELPTAPLVSLGQLQHCALGRAYGNPAINDSMNNDYGDLPTSSGNSEFHPASFPRALGNSFASPFITLNGCANKEYSPSGYSWNYDRCVSANYAMWDTFFFSTITPQTKGIYGSSTNSISGVLTNFMTYSTPLPNIRYQPWLGTAGSVSNAMTNLITGNTINTNAYAKSAAFLMVNGPFNVNSVSVDAWTAVLSGTHNLNIPYLSSIGVSTTNSTGYPFSRFSLSPSGTAINNTYTTNIWGGYNQLSPSQIQSLAQQIVKQIKLRGPALSLAGFVNRDVTSPTTSLALCGPLQAAIDSAKINTNNLPAAPEFTTTSTPTLSWNSKTYTNVAAFTNWSTTGAGTTPWLTQADVLTPIASILTVHSDTFVIRAYGDVTSTKGATLARAWCEAVVQRVPEYVDNSNDPWDSSNFGGDGITLSTVNQNLGRQFRIIQFRWLNQDQL